MTPGTTNHQSVRWLVSSQARWPRVEHAKQHARLTAQRCQWRAELCGSPSLGEGGQFAGAVPGLGGADPLEDLQRLPQVLGRLGGAAGGQGTPAQATQW